MVCHSRLRLLFFALRGSIFAAALHALPAAGAEALTYEKDIRPLLTTYCGDCHMDGSKKGDLDLDIFPDEKSVRANRKVWISVQFQVENWIMPPEEKPHPSPPEREKIARWIDSALNPVDPANPDPGRVTIRRLNRAEYNNTMRDLLGVDLQPASEFPDDDSGYGFDNIGDVLALPPILLERYLIAADRVLIAAIPYDPPRPEVTKYGPGEMHDAGFPMKRTRLLAFNAETTFDYTVPWDGDYTIRVRTWGDQGGDEPPRLELRGPDGNVLHRTQVKAGEDEPQVEEVTAPLKKGPVKLTLAFTNDFYDPDVPDPKRRDRNLYIDSAEIEGPVNAKAPPMAAPLQALIEATGGEADEKAARSMLERFASRAFRRAALPAELDRLMRVYAVGKELNESHRGALRLAMKAALVSPHFLYRIESQPEPDNPAKIADLNEYALASRLSYWLWSSMPDEELLSLAARQELRAKLRPQIERMLSNPKARALPENFGGQWLELRTLDSTQPDKERFPDYSKELAAAFRHETEEFFLHIVKENRSVLDFVGGDYTFLNEKLAAFYGIGGVQGGEFRQVKLDAASRRRGVLTHGSVLTVTSEATRTSPVKRGKWLMENILGISPPPPPPNVPPLGEGKQAELTGTLRQRLEAHRSKPGCISCHRLLDPLGFGFENFDGIGRWRDKEGNFPVDSTGELTTGQKFTTAGELTDILLADKRDAFLRCFVKKMMTYALGRGIEATDRPFVDEVLRRMQAENNTFRSMVIAIAESLPFQKRRGDHFASMPDGGK